MNPFDLLKNLDMGSLKQNLEKAKEEIASIEATGSSGGNIVKITLNGKMEIKKIFLDPICVDPRDIQMLQDLIVAAHHDAMTKIQEQIKDKYGPMLSGMNLAGMGL